MIENSCHDDDEIPLVFFTICNIYFYEPTMFAIYIRFLKGHGSFIVNLIADKIFIIHDGKFDKYLPNKTRFQIILLNLVHIFIVDIYFVTLLFSISTLIIYENNWIKIVSLSYQICENIITIILLYMSNTFERVLLYNCLLFHRKEHSIDALITCQYWSQIIVA